MNTAICSPTVLDVTNETQVLTSPNYLSLYESNLDCIWLLQMNKDFSNGLIMLHITDLDLDDTKDCMSNYLEIHYTQVKYI